MMKPAKINLAPFIALIFAGLGHLHSVDIHPERVTGIVGGEVQINCEVEYGPHYEMTWDFNNEFVYIITSGEVKYPLGNSKYLVHKTGMNFTLTIKDLSVKDGGEYMCTSFTSEATAFLVVLDTPSITLNPPAPVDGETAKVTCEARFGGPKKNLTLPDHNPTLMMHLKGSSSSEIFTGKSTEHNNENYFIISLTKDLTVHARMNTKDITCEIRTAEPSMKRSGVAVLNVLYSLRDIYITPDQERYQVGETITCIADSNPAAVYEWKEAKRGTQINEKWLKITESMIGENNWECVARNIINGEWFEKQRQISFVTDSLAVPTAVDPLKSRNNSLAVTIAVDPPTSGNDSSAVIIAVVSVIISILVAIAAVAFYCWKKMKKSKDSHTNGNANNLQELESVEAEKLLQNNPQRNDGSGSSENEITVRNQEQQSDVTQLLQPTIQQEKDGSGASEHSVEGNLMDQESDVTEPVSPLNISQGNDGSGALEHLMKGNLPDQESDVTEPISPENIQQGNDGSGSSESSITVTNEEKQSKLSKPTVQQEIDGSGASEHSIQPNIQQGKDGSDSSKHLTEVKIPEKKLEVTKPLQQNIPKGNDVGSGLSENSIKQNIQQGNDCSGSSEHSIKPNIQQGKDGSGPSGHAYQDEKPHEPKFGSSECIQLLKSVQDKKELDQNGKEILRVLKEDGTSILEKDPNLLIVLIKKAGNLMDSECYEDIIKVAPHGGKDSPLKYLLDILWSGEENFKKLFKDQKKLMSVIKIISSHGDVQYRTQCLNYIMIGVSFSGIKCKFEWSEEYLSTVKDLLAKGADPTWIHPKMLDRKKRTTAQNQFFFQIFVNLWETNKLHGSLLQVVPLMLSKKCNNNELLNRTLLHEFVAHRWNYIATNLGRLPPDFFYQFKNILREILRHNGTLLVQRDMLGRTPLQYFLIFIVLDESIFGDVREIIQLLQSPEVLSVEDDKWQTALHYLAKNFPVIQGEVTQSGKESLLELVKNFASQSNVCSRDEDGKTALHLLVLNPNYSELFLDVVKILKTASNIKDAKKLTPLEILLQQYPSKVSESSVPTFLDTVKFLNTHTDTNLQYKEGTKALHTTAAQFGRNLPLYSLNIYCEFFQILASKRNVTFQDERGQTALHILARKFPSDISEESRVVYQNVMKHLATYDILEKKDKNGQTALHILAGKFTFEISTHVMETFLEVIKILAVPSNICIQNPQGLTAFKIISQRYGNEVPEHCKDKFQEISEILSENN